jgi:PEP-CTERM motif-containing protein
MHKTNWLGLLIGFAAVLLFSVSTARATSTCTPLGYSADCNLLITVNADGSTTSTNPSLVPYDGTEDQYVGVLNNDPNLTVNSISLSGIGIFQFDADGAFAGNKTCTFDSSTGYWDICSGSSSSPGYGCTTTYTAATYPCGTGGGTSGGPGDNGYASAGVNFSGITLGNGYSAPDTGTILFLNGGLSDGQLGRFSLEERASLTGVGVTGINSVVTPEPSTFSVMLIGLGLLGLTLVMRKRAARGVPSAT